MAEAALAAPSADNRHDWRLEVVGRSLRLRPVVRRSPAEAAAGTARRLRLAWLSAGAVAENVERRAARLGWRTEPASPVETSDGPALAWHFTPRPSSAEPVDDPLERAIATRCTNRRMRYGGGAVPASSLQAWQALAAADGSCALTWIEGAGTRRAAAGTFWRAERERFRHAELHAELYEAVRLDLPPGAPAEHGIPVGALGLNGFERAAFAAQRRWGLQRLANLVGGAEASAARSVALPVLLAPHLGVVHTAGDGLLDAFAAGRALQRVWLAAAAEGAAFQMFAALSLYRIEGLAPLSTLQRRALHDAAALWVPPGRLPQMVFRVGFAPAPAARAARPSAEGVLSQAAEPEEDPHVVEVAPVPAR